MRWWTFYWMLNEILFKGFVVNFECWQWHTENLSDIVHRAFVSKILETYWSLDPGHCASKKLRYDHK